MAGLILLQIYRYVKRSQRYQLFFEEVNDSCGDDEAKNWLSGFKQLAREKLIDKMNFVQSMREAGIEEEGIRPYDYNEDVPSLEEIPERSMADLTASLTEVVPENVRQLASLMNIISILVPQRGIGVSCTLQKQGNDPGKVGITVTVRDIGRKQEPRVHTIWESNKAYTEMKGPMASSGKGAQIASLLFERYTLLLEPAAFWLALEIYRIKMLDPTFSWQEIAEQVPQIKHRSMQLAEQ